jgi:coenzyme F420-reducing hydrogenase gamma subunit
VKKFSITPYKESETGELEEVEEIIDVDGELKGCTPFTCEVMPQVRHNNHHNSSSTHLSITIILTACFSLWCRRCGLFSKRTGA